MLIPSALTTKSVPGFYLLRVQGGQQWGVPPAEEAGSALQVHPPSHSKKARRTAVDGSATDPKMLSWRDFGLRSRVHLPPDYRRSESAATPGTLLNPVLQAGRPQMSGDVEGIPEIGSLDRMVRVGYTVGNPVGALVRRRLGSHS